MIFLFLTRYTRVNPTFSQRSGRSRVLTLLSQAHNMPMQIHSELRECVKQTSALGLSSNELGRAEKRWRPQGHHHRGFFCLLENCMNSHQFSSRPKSLSPVASWRCLTTLTVLSPHVPVLHASERKTLARPWWEQWFSVRSWGGEPSFPSMERPKRPQRLGIMARAVQFLAKEFVVVRGTRN